MSDPKPLGELTKRQGEILDFIADEIIGSMCPPTVREIGKRFGIKCPTGVTCHLKPLTKKGYITIVKAQSRGIRLTEAAMELYT
jgi:repressor LexA